ncbi:hypothetical protein [Croceimicrobium hydrocarbonivorans]|uniref:Lipoprotein n=1 Tax=Croceimicrobium hydrocarbonivorans TaxID=2761580 RepID=A0A7H0VFP2_9FLAO|nr:hypothetical protein [Croceimicrobium hydrocarbonivorans]QNR24540.1 hypothetical protein H4K34_01485 [Croceimicrobium hydrocarbonivorans]
MKRILLLILVAFGLGSCNDPKGSGKETEMEPIRNEQNEQSVLSWSKIKDKFPSQDILQYDFKSDGKPINDLTKAVKLDSLTFNELVTKVKHYAEWKEYLEIFYFSKIKIENQELGVFLLKREFDGTEYSFDLIQLDSNGDIKKVVRMANSWSAAECMGYTRATLDLKLNQIQQEVIQKCYDEEAESFNTVDSILSISSLGNLDFKILRLDTVAI